jgi:hypothetical protein
MFDRRFVLDKWVKHNEKAAPPVIARQCRESLILLGIFLHSILRHAVVGFSHAFLRLVLLLHPQLAASLVRWIP